MLSNVEKGKIVKCSCYVMLKRESREMFLMLNNSEKGKVREVLRGK